MADEKKILALAEKDKGNAAYKNKHFATALTHYEKAMELDPTNIAIRSNRGAVYLEKGQYDKCIEECQKAVEIGREHRADFTLIAKALARIGNAYFKLEDYENALTFFNKSLSENRSSDVVKKVQEVEKLLKKKERLAYINPKIAFDERQKGYFCFKKGDYPTAIKHYTEVIKKNPKDARVFSNRSACYMKLMEFNLALKDSDECIRLDPKYIKGYLRKAGCLVAMKEMIEASVLYQKAMDLDHSCQEAIDGYRRCVVEEGKTPEAVRQHIDVDPEAHALLGDRAMEMIMEHMSKVPKAVQDLLKNPAIAVDIEKRLEVGVINMR